MTLIDNANRKAWTTHDECSFIKSLYTRHGQEILKSYIQSCRLRRRWDGIDKSVALDTARRLLANGV